MKVCPNCQSRFDPGEAFCPDDGTELVEAEGLSFGRFTNQTLGDGVEIGGLVEHDAVGTRYRGSLADSEKSVAVTIFNQRAEPNDARLDDLEATLQTLGGPLPRQVLATHSLDLDAEEPYLVEQAPEGRSLRALLDEEGPLDWQRAIKLTARLAQVLDWMAERGYVHRGLHPGAIYVSEGDDPTVQIGDWLQIELSYWNEPLEAAEADDGFVGFAAYLPPEAIEDDSEIDERSLVYSLGMLLYEMVLGRPPFDSDDPSEVLQSQLDETPLQLGVASDDRQLHPELDNILGMMWDKDPESRFQKPGAIVAALSSLVDDSPKELAPETQVADEPFFDGDSPANDDSDGQKATLIGMSATDVQEATSEKPDTASDQPDTDSEEGDLADDSSIIIEDPELRSAMDEDSSSADDPEPTERAEEAPGEQPGDPDDSAAWDALSEEIDSEPSGDETETDAVCETADTIPDDRVQIEQTEDEDSQNVGEEEHDGQVDDSGDVVVLDETDETAADSDTEEPEEPEETDDSSEQTPEMDAFSADDDPEVDVTDEWFEVDEKEAWMAADVREERDRSEVIRQYATKAVWAVLILVALGLFIFAQTYEPSNPDNGSNSGTETSTE